VIEFDPAYCDQIVRRFEQVTGKPATAITPRKMVAADKSASE
jgi:hypothetical protein